MWYQLHWQRSVFMKDDRVKLYTNQTIVIYTATEAINRIKQLRYNSNVKKSKINKSLLWVINNSSYFMVVRKEVII